MPLLVTRLTCAPEDRPADGVVVAGGDAKFLQGVESGAHCTLKCVAVQLVVVVEAVERDVGLVAARTVDGTAAAVVILVDVVSE